MRNSLENTRNLDKIDSYLSLSIYSSVHDLKGLMELPNSVMTSIVLAQDFLIVASTCKYDSLSNTIIIHS